MSSAFIKEGDYQKLNEVEPTMGALLFYLRRENGGQAISETGSYHSRKHGKEVHEMSDGLAYALNYEQQWFIILDDIK
ncbi:MAG TPA: hypothetical protein VGM63_00325 [Mucilaginibacter sp.]